jgi:hypothetical protein
MKKLMAFLLVSLLAAASVTADEEQRISMPRRAPALSDTGPAYVHVWAREYTETIAGVPQYHVVHIDLFVGEVANATLKIRNIVAEGGLAVGMSFFPMHMIEKIEVRVNAPKP